MTGSPQIVSYLFDEAACLECPWVDYMAGRGMALVPCCPLLGGGLTGSERSG